MRKVIGLAAGMLMTLTGCAGQNIDDYKALKPQLDVREYLNGDLEAWGMMFDWAGDQSMRFHVKMKGTWKGNDGTLEEFFTYDDGSTQQRVWTIRFNDDNTFTATASDVVGEAKGRQQGNTVNMLYTLRVPRNGSTIDLTLDDWLYRIDEKTVINRTAMRKFGIQVGELMIAFRKP